MHKVKMKMAKRGQITLFIIAGIAILFLFVGLLMVLKPKDTNQSRANAAAFDSYVAATRSYVNSCLDKSLFEASESYPFRQENKRLQEAYIEARLRECNDFTRLTGKGIDISEGNAKVEVILTDNVLVAHATYPLTISDGKLKASISEFSSQIKMNSESKLVQGSDGIEKGVDIVSGNRKAELILIEKTAAIKDGHVVDSIGIKMTERNFENLGNTQVIGSTVYEGEPDGALFDKPAVIKISYSNAELPEGTDENSLAIAYYDLESKRWVGLESYVDAQSKSVSARINHFTKFAIVAGCGKSNPQEIQFGFIDNCASNSGEQSFSFSFIKDGDSTCVRDKEPIYIKLNCDGQCGEVLFNGQALQKKEDSYAVLSAGLLKKSGQENILTIKSEKNGCNSAQGTFSLFGTGMLPKCGSGKIARSCTCGQINLGPVYDDQAYRSLITNRDYRELSDNELEKAVSPGSQSYCCEDKPSRKPCQESAQTSQQACSVQDRINLLCKYGPNNDVNYNPAYPSCNGVVNGRPVGFADPSIGEELNILTNYNRDSGLTTVTEYSSGGKYSKNLFCNLQQGTKSQQTSGEGNRVMDATLMGPNSSSVGDVIQLEANLAGNSLQNADIWIATSDYRSPYPYKCNGKIIGEWCLISEARLSGNTGKIAGQWTPQQPGQYIAAVNAYQNDGKKCTGNPNRPLPKDWLECAKGSISIKISEKTGNKFSVFVSGPATANQGEMLTFSASVNNIPKENTLSKGSLYAMAEIWATTADQKLPEGCNGEKSGPWCLLQRKYIDAPDPTTFNAEWKPAKSGKYIAVVNGFTSLIKCSGNPFGIPSDWIRCGTQDSIVVDVKEKSEGIIVSEGNYEKVYEGRGLERYCTKDSLGIVDNINGREGYDLLCTANKGYYQFIECDTDGKTERQPRDAGKTSVQGTIIDVKGSDYICASNDGYEQWEKCGGEPLSGGQGLYIPDKGTTDVNNKRFYCCHDRLYTAPCSQVEPKQSNLCIHTEFSDLTSEDKQLQLARDTGASYIKQIFPWKSAQPNGPEEYDWKTFDRWFEKIRTKNLKVIARISLAPEWARTEKGVNTGYKSDYCGFGCEISTRPDMDKIGKFSEFIGKFVERYKPEYVQIWNEPNLAIEWSNKGVNPSEYNQMLKSAYTAIKKANPDTQVIMGGLAPTTTDSFKENNGLVSSDEFEFIDGMYKADKDIGNYYDLIGVNSHPFPETTASMKCDGSTPKLTNPFDNSIEVSWMINGQKDQYGKPTNAGGNCWAFDRVRLLHDYFAKKIVASNLDSPKKIAIMEYSTYLNSYFQYRRDMSDKNAVKDEENRQAAELKSGYERASTEWKDWVGPVCWFLASTPDKWENEGNFFKKDYTVRSSACSYGIYSGRPQLSSFSDSCTQLV
ncbi:hypothetical protein HYY72_00070 [Candidatus Woesearchaeota archaeon]|nr:hypothetical protein [Candidatus Woesearchaeota archaeon]